MSMYRRWPVVLSVLAAVVLTLQPVTNAHRNNTFDAMSLLSRRQHVTRIVTLAALTVDVHSHTSAWHAR